MATGNLPGENTLEIRPRENERRRITSEGGPGLLFRCKTFCKSESGKDLSHLVILLISFEIHLDLLSEP